MTLTTTPAVRWPRRDVSGLLAVAALVISAGAAHPARAQPANARAAGGLPTAEYCVPEEVDENSPVIWAGSQRMMPIHQLAAYAAPVLWFSPDEPLLKKGPRRLRGKDIALPEPLPFEEDTGEPVVYYRIRRILQRLDEPGGGAYIKAPDRGESMIDLRMVGGIDIDFFFYYSMDLGGNPHEHDVEWIETRIGIARRTDCPDGPYVAALVRVDAKAHGVRWFDNSLDVDASAILPMHILVEEGKHASCTDRNADGVYTPGYDVSERVNDAWGVRDTLGTGVFFTGDYKAWMSKIRRADGRVFPPLPPDSPLRTEWTIDGEYAPQNAIYTLRPWPSAEKADSDLVNYMADKGDPDWPEVVPDNDLQHFERWLYDESWTQSWALALRGANDGIGLSLAFPLLIFKNVQDPLTGGWLVHRVYYQGEWEDVGWMINYSTSASRWVDGYFAIGVEWDRFVQDGVQMTERHTVTETGVKLRFDITRTPLRFMRKLGTSFFGVRVGFQFRGVWDFDRIGYVFEFGAGSW